MINAIAGVTKEVKDKPVPQWRWPQYASVSVRNRSFANIDPSVDRLNLGEYDAATITSATLTDTYNFFRGGLAGKNIGTVVLTYSDATKTNLTSFTKTPIVTI